MEGEGGRELTRLVKLLCDAFDDEGAVAELRPATLLPPRSEWQRPCAVGRVEGVPTSNDVRKGAPRPSVHCIQTRPHETHARLSSFLLLHASPLVPHALAVMDAPVGSA
jgi:hypothetical protein